MFVIGDLPVDILGRHQPLFDQQGLQRLGSKRDKRFLNRLKAHPMCSLSGWFQVTVPEVDRKKLSRIARLAPDFVATEGDAVNDLWAVAKQMRVRIRQNLMSMAVTYHTGFSSQISGAT